MAELLQEAQANAGTNPQRAIQLYKEILKDTAGRTFVHFE
jgi:hypothetical protein